MTEPDDDLMQRIYACAFDGQDDPDLDLRVEGYGRDSHRFTGSVRRGGATYEFEIIDGPGNGTEVQTWERISAPDILADGMSASIRDGLRRVRND